MKLLVILLLTTLIMQSYAQDNDGDDANDGNGDGGDDANADTQQSKFEQNIV